MQSALCDQTSNHADDNARSGGEANQKDSERGSQVRDYLSEETVLTSFIS